MLENSEGRTPGPEAKPGRNSTGHRSRLVLALVLALSPMAGSAGQPDDELERMFAWWNLAMAGAAELSAEGFSRHFTEDAVIIVNDRVLARGIPEMLNHFRAIRARTDKVEIQLPFEEAFREGDKLFTHHLIHAREDGRDRTTHVMGYAELADGRISLVNFVSYSEYED